jgi:hypothetical protein
VQLAVGTTDTQDSQTLRATCGLKFVAGFLFFFLFSFLDEVDREYSVPGNNPS